MILRPTVRLLVINDQQRVLLFKTIDTQPWHRDLPTMVDYWVTPGGGVDPGESFEEAALRELWEETGIRTDAVGDVIWMHERILDLPDRSMLLQERFFVVRVTDQQVHWDNLLEYERAIHHEFRWWSVDEIEGSSESFMPIDLAQRLRQWVSSPLGPT